MRSALRQHTRAGILALAGWWSAGAVAQSDAVEVRTAAQGERITVTASADLSVEPRTVWSVIADYDRLAEFIPDMQSSRVIRRDGHTLIVEQTGRFHFLFFTQSVEVKLAVVETPQQRIVAHALAGSFKEMEGRYVLEPLPSGQVRLSYAGQLIPAFEVPPLIGPVVIRRVLARQFEALVKEILRRDALARGAAAPR